MVDSKENYKFDLGVKELKCFSIKFCYTKRNIITTDNQKNGKQ